MHATSRQCLLPNFIFSGKNKEATIYGGNFNFLLHYGTFVTSRSSNETVDGFLYYEALASALNMKIRIECDFVLVEAFNLQRLQSTCVASGPKSSTRRSGSHTNVNACTAYDTSAPRRVWGHHPEPLERASNFTIKIHVLDASPTRVPIRS